MNKDERNARRREQYAAKQQTRTDAQRGANALANVARLDGFVSSSTGAGTTGVDKFKSYTFEGRDTLSDETLECLYLDNDIAAAVVEQVVKDALRAGYELQWEGAEDTLRRETVEWAETLFSVTPVVERARIYARLFGGGAVFIGTDDGALDVPRTEGAPVAFLRAIASKDLTPAAWYADPSKQDFSTVAIYDMLVPTFSQATTERNYGTNSSPRIAVDSTRTAEFYGLLTTDDRFRTTGWGDSVLRRVYDALLQFEAAYQSVMHTLSENSIPVYKVEGLLNMLASENADLLQARFQLINYGKSAYRAIVLGENESFERVNAPLSEAANVVGAAMDRVAGASGIPTTILFGRSPAGMNATGQSDLEIWNQQVVKEQSLVIGPVLRELYTVLLADPASPLGGNIPEDLSVVFPSLWTPSLQDEVNNYAQVAGADAAYIANKVLLPEEVAIKRATEGGQFPSIDIETRRETMVMNIEKLIEKAGNPDPVPPPFPGQPIAGSEAPVEAPEDAPGTDAPEEDKEV